MLDRSTAALERWTSGKRLLLVEDEILVALPLIESFQEFGMAVLGPIGTLERTLGAIKRLDFDAAILDVNLAGLPSWPAASALLDARIPFVFVTGYVDEESFPLQLRSVPRLTKPAEPSAILNVLYERWVEVRKP